MAHIRCDFRSEILDMGTSMTVILPEGNDASSVPALYLLHGLADNCTGWTRYTSVERYAREYGIAVIIPEVQRSFYADMASGLDYFKFIHDELPEICKHLFNITADPRMTYIAGLSMGGYGAMKCALTTPKRYAGCGAFSAVMNIKKTFSEAKDGRRSEYDAIFGASVPSVSDLHTLLENVDASIFPSVYISCGEDDVRLEQSIEMKHLLDAKGIANTFESWPGDHNWIFWDSAVKKCLDFFFGGK